MPSLQAIRFDTSDWKLVETSTQRIVWDNDLADQLSLNYFDLPPNIGADTADLDALRQFYRQLARQANIGIVSVDHVWLAGMLSIQTIFKVPQQPHGMAYVGSYTLPRAMFSYVIKVQGAELGATGIRDAFVLNEFFGNAEWPVNEPAPLGWFQDPYDPSYREGVLRNQSEDGQYDALFPDHPLSRIRRYLVGIAESIAIDETIGQAAPFHGSAAQGEDTAPQQRPWWKRWRK